MALGPSVSAVAFLAVINEVTFVTCAIRVKSEAVFAVSLVIQPLAFILSHYAISVFLAVINLKAVSMSNHFVSLLS